MAISARRLVGLFYHPARHVRVVVETHPEPSLRLSYSRGGLRAPRDAPARVRALPGRVPTVAVSRLNLRTSEVEPVLEAQMTRGQDLRERDVPWIDRVHDAEPVGDAQIAEPGLGVAGRV